jgi:hypothetical protein
MEFSLEEGRLAGRIWAGDDAVNALPWPAFVTDAGPLPVEILGRAQDISGGSAEVHYLVRPSTQDDLVLDVVERYEVSEDGRSLTGIVRVRFTGGEANRGGFTLHRRFEAER